MLNDFNMLGGSNRISERLRYRGDTDLELATPLTVAGTDAAHFAIQSQPAASTLGPSEYTSFTVRFTPSTTGTKTAFVSIGNNDADEDPYDLVLEGEDTAVFVEGPDAMT